jgi:hypothetical protein
MHLDTSSSVGLGSSGFYSVSSGVVRAEKVDVIGDEV